MVGGLTLQALGMAWIAVIADAGHDLRRACCRSSWPASASMAIPAAQNSVVGAVAEEDVGKAAGANSMMRELGGCSGSRSAVAVFAGAGSYASP